MSGLAAVGAGVGLFGSMANLFQQHKHREYQREFAENAAQIRARDLEAAGLSKTLAAGSPAQAPHGEAPQMNMETMYHGAKVGAEISHVKAQTDLLKAQAEQTRQSTFHSQDLHGYNINKIANEIVGIQYKNSGELISQERAVEELGDYLVHRVMRLEKASVDIQLVEAELKKALKNKSCTSLFFKLNFLTHFAKKSISGIFFPVI